MSADHVTRRLLTAVAAAVLGGCAGLPMYQPAAGQPLATIKLSPNLASQAMPLSFCDGRRCYDLKSSHGELQVPTGERLMLFKCSPDLTFVPYPGVVYYADFALRAEHCVLGLYRDAPASRVGILFEPTVRAVPHKHAG